MHRASGWMVSSTFGIVLAACSSSVGADPCTKDQAACFVEATAKVDALGEPHRDAREVSRAAVADFERACDNGLVRACEAALGYWVAIERSPRSDTDPGVDALTGAELQLPGELPTPAQAHAKARAAWTAYERASFNQAEQQKTEGAITAFLARFAHGPHAEAARTRLVALHFEPIAAEARRSKSSTPVLDFAEKYPSSHPARALLVELGLEGRSRDELVRIALLGKAPDTDPSFHTFAESAAEREADLALTDAAKLPGEAGVAAIRGWIDGHPGAKQGERAKTLLGDKAYEVVAAKSGEDALAAIRGYQQSYPNSTHAAELRAREVSLSAELALAATTSDPMWRFVDGYPNEPQAGALETALTTLLLRADSHEPAASYEKWLKTFPNAREARAISTQLATIRRHELRDAGIRKHEEDRYRREMEARDAQDRARRECTARCVAGADTQCAAQSGASVGGPNLSPKAMCISNALRPCCTKCGTSIDTGSYATCN